MTTFPRQKCCRFSSVIIWKVSPPAIPSLQRSSFVQAWPYRPVCYILVSQNAVQFEDVRFCRRAIQFITELVLDPFRDWGQLFCDSMKTITVVDTS